MARKKKDPAYTNVRNPIHQKVYMIPNIDPKRHPFAEGSALRRRLPPLKKGEWILLVYLEP